MSPVSIAISALFLYSVVAAVADDEIAEVQTLRELRQVKPVALPGGGEVRLGLAESGTDGGPWKLLYCLEKGGNGVRDSVAYQANQQQLGPVYFTVKPPRTASSVQQSELTQRALSARQIEAAYREGLYCARVVTAFPGKYGLTVHTADGKVIQKKTFEVIRVTSAYWLELAETEGGRQMAKSPSAGAPRFDGDRVIARMDDKWLWFGGRKFGLTNLATSENRSPLANDLPGGIPLEGRLESVFNRNPTRPGQPRFPLLLTMDGDDLVIQSVAVDLENNYGQGAFLAKWWLNGQPVLPELPCEPMHEAMQQAMQQEKLLYKLKAGLRVTERRWRFVLPRIFKSLRAGDHIRLQTLYCPQGYDQLLEVAEIAGRDLMQDRDNSTPTVPLLSNPLEFVVSDANPKSPQVRVRPGQPTPQPRGTVNKTED